MNRKKRIMSLVLLVSMILTMSACGKGTADASSSDNKEGSTITSSITEEDANTVKISKEGEAGEVSYTLTNNIDINEMAVFYGMPAGNSIKNPRYIDVTGLSLDEAKSRDIIPLGSFVGEECVFNYQSTGYTWSEHYDPVVPLTDLYDAPTEYTCPITQEDVYTAFTCSNIELTTLEDKHYATVTVKNDTYVEGIPEVFVMLAMYYDDELVGLSEMEYDQCSTVLLPIGATARITAQMAIEPEFNVAESDSSRITYKTFVVPMQVKLMDSFFKPACAAEDIRCMYRTDADGTYIYVKNISGEPILFSDVSYRLVDAEGNTRATQKFDVFLRNEICLQPDAGVWLNFDDAAQPLLTDEKLDTYSLHVMLHEPRDPETEGYFRGDIEPITIYPNELVEGEEEHIIERLVWTEGEPGYSGDYNIAQDPSIRYSYWSVMLPDHCAAYTYKGNDNTVYIKDTNEVNTTERACGVTYYMNTVHDPNYAEDCCTALLID